VMESSDPPSQSYPPTQEHLCGGWLHGRPKGGTTATFVVECYWPGIDEAQVRDVLTRVTRLRPGTAAPRRAVRSLGCILVPSDGLALFLFEGPSAALVDEESAWAQVPFDRIVEAVRIGSADART
jgi:hypothetical protein